MHCPNCQQTNLSVLEKRDIEDGIRRRRLCNKCQYRFTTYERIEKSQITVLKRNGGRELYHEQKVRRGLQLACKNRPVQLEQIEKAARKVTKLLQQGEEELVSSNQIGELVLAQLKQLDLVAYLRFASVHRSFPDITSFKKEIQKIEKNNH